MLSVDDVVIQALFRACIPGDHDRLSRRSCHLRRQHIVGISDNWSVIIRIVLPFQQAGAANSLTPLVSLPEPPEQCLIDFLCLILVHKQFVDLGHASQRFDLEKTAAQTNLTFISFGLRD